MAIDLQDPSQLEGATVTGSAGDKLGKVEAIYYDNETNKPEWAAVKSGLFGSRVSLVPLATAEFDGDKLQVPYDKKQIKQAPHHDPTQDLSPRDEEELFRYYGVPYGRQSVTAEGTNPATGSGPVPEASQWGDSRGHGPSGQTADDAMTRSEERIRVGAESAVAGRARLRKYVVTEHQQTTVPVSHEEVRLEREPITDANRDRAMSGPEISEAAHEVTLHAERPVVDKEAVPVERVRLGTETVTAQEQVSTDVRKEQIDVEDPSAGSGTGRPG